MTRRLIWLAVLAALLTGLPVTLWILGGPPLHWPGHLPSPARLRTELAGVPQDADLLLPAVRLAGWLAWTWFAAAFGIEAYARGRGRKTRRIRGMAWAQELTARVLTAATVGVTGMVPLVKIAAAPVTAAPVLPGPARLDAAVRVPEHVPDRADPGYRLYTVRRGDTLWGIAARELGNPLRFREIASLNQGRIMDDGRTFGDARWIYPGWVLRLPAPPGRAAAAPAPASKLTPAATAGSEDRHGEASCPAADTRVAARPAAGIRLPSGAVVGISFAAAISSAVVTARIRRSRRRVMQPVSEEPAPAEPPLARPVAIMRQACLGTGPEARPLPLLVSPGKLICAHAADGSELRLDLADAGGLGITGEGAADVARAVLCGLLLGAQRAPARILIPAPDIRSLLGTDTGKLPGLTVTSDLAAALAELETGILRRARLLDEHGADARSECPVILIATITDPDSPRLTKLLSRGAEHDISAVLLGDWAPGTTCRVGADGLVDHVTGNAVDGLAGASMFRLAPDEALDIIRLAGDASPQASAGSAATPRTAIPGPRSAGRPQAEQPADAARRPVQVTVLGPPVIRVHGREITSGLRTDARNLLALLAVHKDGLSIEAAAGALWPEASPAQASPRFHTAVNNIRPVLRAAAGIQSAMFIAHAAGRYRLDPRLTDSDLWHFEDELRQAAQVGDSDRTSCLRRAAGAYTGPLLDGCALEWAEPPRESIRRRAADTLRQLADITWDHDPDGALGYLERALAVDEYNEELHQHIMRRQASLGRHDAISRTYQHLERRLAQIDAVPDPSSQALAEDLLQPHKT